MKKIFLAIVAFAVVSSVSAQDKKFWFGGEAGVGVSHRSSYLDPIPGVGEFAFNVSFRGEYLLSPKFSLISGLGYQNFNEYWDHVPIRNPDGSASPSFTNVTISYSMIRIPLAINYKPIKRLSLELGIINQFLVQEVVEGSGEETYSNLNYDLKTYFPSLEIAAGYELLQKESFKLNTSLFAEYSSNTAQYNNPLFFQYYGLRTAFMF